MALIGVSLIVASFVLVCLRPPQWLPRFLANLRQQRLGGPAPRAPATPPKADRVQEGAGKESLSAGPPEPIIQEPEPTAQEAERQGSGKAIEPAPIIGEPRVAVTDTSPEDAGGSEANKAEDEPEEEQTTPKASATTRDDPVPALVLPAMSTTSESSADQAPPEIALPVTTAPTPQLHVALKPPKSASALMPPPPLPDTTTKKFQPSGIPQPKASSAPRRIPTLNGHSPSTGPAPIRERNLPVPRRSGAPPATGLMPPPTATSIPKKPSRQVTLAPGHSPLDWARLAQSPTSDLRGLPPGTSYLRVTPSMLRQQNGRKGTDAWTAFNGKVYNISPYISFHPGGRPELLRGAGKDGTRLFAEVHPWVNYETMLQSCLIGLLVDEHESTNKMEEMD